MPTQERGDMTGIQNVSKKKEYTEKRRGLRWEWGIFLRWNSEWCGDHFLQNTITVQRRPQPKQTKCISSQGGRPHQHLKNLKMVKKHPRQIHVDVWQNQYSIVKELASN